MPSTSLTTSADISIRPSARSSSGRAPAWRGRSGCSIAPASRAQPIAAPAPDGQATNNEGVGLPGNRASLRHDHPGGASMMARRLALALVLLALPTAASAQLLAPQTTWANDHAQFVIQ